MISITTLAVCYQCLLRLFHLCFWTGGLALHVHITENPKLAVSLFAKLEFYSSWVITSFSTGTPVIRAMKQRTSSTQLLWYVQKHPSLTCKKVRWRLGYGQMRECRMSLLCTLNLKQKWNCLLCKLSFCTLNLQLFARTAQGCWAPFRVAWSRTSQSDMSHHFDRCLWRDCQGISF